MRIPTSALFACLVSCASHALPPTPLPVPVSERASLDEIIQSRPHLLVVSEEAPDWVNASDAWFYDNAMYGVGHAKTIGSGRLAEESAKMAARAAIAQRLETFVGKLQQHYDGKTIDTNHETKTFSAGTMRDVAIRQIWHDGKDRWAALAELQNPQQNFIGATEELTIHPFLCLDPEPLIGLFHQARLAVKLGG